MSYVAALTSVTVRACTQFLALGLTLYSARVLQPYDFGVYSIATVVILYIRTALYTGGYEYLLKSSEPGRYSTEVLAANLAITAVFSVFAVAFAIVSPSLFGDTTVEKLILVLAPSNFVCALAAWAEVHLLRNKSVNTYYWIMLLVELMASAVAFLMLYLGYGLIALVIQAYTRAALNLVLVVVVHRPTLSDNFNPRRVWDVVSWSVPRYTELGLSYVTMYAGDFVLGAYLSPAASGMYRAAGKICTAATDMVNQPVKLFALTTFSRLASKHKKPEDAFAPLAALGALASGTVLGAFAAVADIAIPFVLGEAWRESASLIPIICIGRALSIVNNISTSLLVASNKQNYSLAYTAVAASAALLVSFIAAPYGVHMLAMAGAFLAIVMSGFLLMMVFRTFPGTARSALLELSITFGACILTFSATKAARGLIDGAGWPTLLIIIAACAVGAIPSLLATMTRGVSHMRRLRNLG